MNYKPVWLLLVLAGLCTSLPSQDTLYVCNPGDPIQLVADRGDFLYLWSPSTCLDNATIYNPIARPLEEMTYIVQQIKFEPTANLIKNADFSNGNVDFYSDYPFVTNISTQGVFGINTSAMNLNPVFFDDCPDHTSGTGQMMVVDGSPVANERVWCQTIDILPNRTYAFSAWLTSVKRENPAMLRFSINGLPIGQIFSASPITCEWKQFYELWNSESATTADICIVNQNTNPDGNDFALDDFAFFELEEIEADTFVIIVEALVAAERKNVFIPNAFSPNDDGINDLFEIYLGKGAESIESLSIYDRWGNKMLDYQDCFLSENCRWDGTFNGNRVNGGTYIYSTVVNFVNGNTEHFSGTILLSR